MGFWLWELFVGHLAHAVPALWVCRIAVAPALSSGVEELQLKRQSNVWNVVFLRYWSKMWFSSLLTVPLRLCTMRP